jgi:hypothetical protein
MCLDELWSNNKEEFCLIEETFPKVIDPDNECRYFAVQCFQEFHLLDEEISKEVISYF